MLPLAKKKKKQLTCTDFLLPSLLVSARIHNRVILSLIFPQFAPVCAHGFSYSGCSISGETMCDCVYVLILLFAR